jgi:hypothetical protein
MSTTKSRTGDVKTCTSVAENDLRIALARVAQGVYAVEGAPFQPGEKAVCSCAWPCQPTLPKGQRAAVMAIRINRVTSPEIVNRNKQSVAAPLHKAAVLLRRPLFTAHLVAGARYRKLEGRLGATGKAAEHRDTWYAASEVECPFIEGAAVDRLN